MCGRFKRSCLIARISSPASTSGVAHVAPSSAGVARTNTRDTDNYLKKEGVRSSETLT